MHVTQGFHEHERGQVAALFWQAFRGKLGFVLGPEPSALAFLTENCSPAHALLVRGKGGVIVGIAGFHDEAGGLVGGDMESLRQHYGPVGSVWRGVMLDMFERQHEEGVVLMDGICVDASVRGGGIGSMLLQEMAEIARAGGAKALRLDVINTNPRAKALYIRHGFEVRERYSVWPFGPFVGFRSAERMELVL